MLVLRKSATPLLALQSISPLKVVLKSQIEASGCLWVSREDNPPNQDVTQDEPCTVQPKYRAPLKLSPLVRCAG